MRRQTQRSCNSLRISNFLSTCSRLLFRSWVFRTIFVSASQVLSLDLTKEILASLQLLDNFPLGRCCCVSLVLLLLFVIQTRTDLLVLSFYLFFDLDSGQPPQWFYYKNVEDCSAHTSIFQIIITEKVHNKKNTFKASRKAWNYWTASPGCLVWTGSNLACWWPCVNYSLLCRSAHASP